MAAPAITDIRDRFIEQVVRGRSFCDAGGLWGTVKEKVSLAAAAGATEYTMVDIAPPGNALWQRFEDRMRDLGVSGYRCVTANLDAADLAERAGRFDVVHTSGVIYHCPNPLHTLTQLAGIAREHLVLTSMVIPEHIETTAGQLDSPPGHAVFVPHLDGGTRAVLREHFEAMGVPNIPGIGYDFTDWNVEDYGPWWWLVPPATLRRWIETTGFRVIDDGEVWPGRSHAFLARREPA